MKYLKLPLLLLAATLLLAQPSWIQRMSFDPLKILRRRQSSFDAYQEMQKKADEFNRLLLGCPVYKETGPPEQCYPSQGTFNAKSFDKTAKAAKAFSAAYDREH